MNYQRYFEKIGVLRLNEKDIFNRIVQDETLTWPEIIDLLKNVKQFEPFIGDFPNNFYDANMFSVLENMGMDYNYLDSSGNNFVQFVYQDSSETFSFFVAREYAVSKTTNIYNINNQGRHLLFDFLSVGKAGFNGEKFFALLEKYPEFDLHQVDNSGHNLINHALLKEAPKEIIEFLIDNNLSLTHIDKTDSNLLNYFCFISYTEKNIELFKQFVQINDLSHTNKWNTSCLTSRIESILVETNSFSFNAHINWITLFLETIRNKEFMHDKTICKRLYDTLKTRKTTLIQGLKKEPNLELLELYNDCMGQLYFDYMNETIPSNEKDIKRKKI